MKNGQVAVVTGGGQGIGRSICLCLVKRGVRVYSLDINDERNSETERMMNAVSPGNRGVHCDVSDPAQVDRVFDEIVAAEGGLHILVNNAAVFSTMSFVKDTYEAGVANWAFNMDTNVKGTFLCAKKAAPVMAKQGRGEIINIITNHLKRELFPVSDCEHCYDASKYAQLSLNESLDSELKQYGIRVNGLCPASTRSPMLEAFFEEAHLELTRENIGKVSGYASLLESEEVAETACAMMEWDRSQPTGKAYLLMYSEDCELLQKGHVERLLI